CTRGAPLRLAAEEAAEQPLPRQSNDSHAVVVEVRGAPGMQVEIDCELLDQRRIGGGGRWLVVPGGPEPPQPPGCLYAASDRDPDGNGGRGDEAPRDLHHARTAREPADDGDGEHDYSLNVAGEGLRLRIPLQQLSRLGRRSNPFVAEKDLIDRLVDEIGNGVDERAARSPGIRSCSLARTHRPSDASRSRAASRPLRPPRRQ